jgi:hypothetical protein
VGVGGTFEGVGVGDGGAYAGGDLGGELVEAVASGTHQYAVEVDVAVDGEVEIASEVHDRGGVTADPHIRERWREQLTDEIDDGIQLVAQSSHGRGRRFRLGAIQPEVEAEILEPVAILGACCRRDPQPRPRAICTRR